MPLVEPSTYRAPPGLSNPHVQTVLPRWVRRLPPPDYRRERIETTDDDVLDLDWLARGDRPLAIVSYGMEGTSRGDYTVGMVRALAAAGWDALVWNYRGCGGEPNRKVHFYHGGLIGDLHTVVRHAIARGHRNLALVGFSLGGNLTLNYLGHFGSDVPDAVRSAVAVSAPVDVTDCARALKRPGGGFYVRRFLRFFREKIRAKAAVMPGAINDDGYDELTTLEAYDERYTVPHFGLESWPNFYRFVSSRFVLPYVRVPTLIVNAQDDPFLGPDCFPVEAARRHPNLFLEMPRCGGHLGFLTFPLRGPNWIERRVVDFLDGSRNRRRPDGA